MMLLAMSSPLLGIGLVMLLQVFETWALGPNRSEGQLRQPPRPTDAPSASRKSLPADRRTDQMPLDSARGAFRVGPNPF
jgi:hypothetical protein